MSDVVWAINPRKDNLRDLVQRMRRFASDVFTAKDVEFEFRAPDIEKNTQLGANIRREVFAIFKEAINNCAKYSACQNARINFEIENEHLLLEIADDGRGFDWAEVMEQSMSHLKGGNGLLNMQRRARELGGKCEIFSDIGKGTTIRLRIQLHALDGNGDLQTNHMGSENRSRMH
jgi:signal transduction histidine kinase